MPISFQHVFEPERVAAIECPSHQVPSAVKINAYRDNGLDKTIGLIFQELERQTISIDETLRIVPYNNLTDGIFHYYFGTANQFQRNNNDKKIIGYSTKIPI